ncbi:MAG: glucokinase [Candidatus Eisenbacteria bacterium]
MRGVILAGDIGGTKTRLALYEPGSPARAPRREQRFVSRDYPSLEALVTSFLTGLERPTHAAFGIAGPVVDGRVDATNLAWHVDAATLAAAIGGQVTLLNDLAATGLGLPVLAATELALLQPGPAGPGTGALIAAGTGLGECILVPEGGVWRTLPSEGGHVDFAPRDPLEDELLIWQRTRHPRVSYERVLSGAGLAELYRFYRDTGRGAAPPGFESAFDGAADPAPLLTAAALDGSCERARLVVERFVSIYGAEAGNLALKTLAIGGVFVGGGIAPRLLPVLEAGGFVAAFAAKGRLSPVLQRIPVAVVLEDRCAMWGAATVALGPGAGAGI